MEIILSRLPSSVVVGVIAESPLHLERIKAMALPNVGITQVITNGDDDARKAVFEFIRLYLRLRPSVVLANTHDSARLLASAARVLPELDKKSFVFVRDFLWTSIDAVFSALPDTTILIPHEVVLERPDYLARIVAQSPARKVFVVPDMVDAPAQPSTPAVNGASLVHLATINPWKGHSHLIQAMRILETEGLQGQVRSHGYVADISMLHRLKAEIETHGLSERLRLLDYAADSAALIRSSSGVVVMSVSHSGGPETFGRTIIEAWAQARPVIAFAAGAPARLIRHQVDGLLVPEGDEHALALAIHAVQSDPRRRRRLGEAGFTRVREAFDAGRVVDRLFAILCGRPEERKLVA